MNEYFEKYGISASLLKALASSPRDAYNLLNSKGRSTKATDFGSLVDCMLTEPERFEIDYVIFRGTKPTDKALDFALEYVRKHEEAVNKEKEYNDNALILSARAEVGYDSRLLEKTLLERFDTQIRPYCTFLINNSDKLIIDEADYNHAQQLASNVKSSPYFEDIFIPNSNLIVLFQVPIYITTPAYEGKMLIDCIVIDLENKTITPYDFKTYEDSFEGNYWKYKYYYQEAWYVGNLLCLTNPDMFIEAKVPEQLELIYSGKYEVKPMKFIAIDKKMYRDTIAYETYPDIHHDVFFEGVIVKGLTNVVKVKPITQLINEFKWRVENNDWVRDFDMATKGIKSLWL